LGYFFSALTAETNYLINYEQRPGQILTARIPGLFTSTNQRPRSYNNPSHATTNSIFQFFFVEPKYESGPDSKNFEETKLRRQRSKSTGGTNEDQSKY
jgi:hypothetical protein